jgi:phosphoribosyl-dephospho-CoA transferase
MIDIYDTKTNINHTAENYGEFLRMMFNIGQRTGYNAETLVFLGGKLLDNMMVGNVEAVHDIERLFDVELDWDQSNISRPMPK